MSLIPRPNIAIVLTWQYQCRLWFGRIDGRGNAVRIEQSYDATHHLHMHYRGTHIVYRGAYHGKI
jgi:hypothetical protein